MKKPEIKVPSFLSDLFSDLRDRRLLPLVGVLAVAIVAVPFALSKSSTPESPGTAAAGGNPDDSLTIVSASHGLRDYRQRLRGDKAKDPFTQQYTGVASAASSKAGEAGAGSGDGAGGGTGSSLSVFGGGTSDTSTVGGASIPSDSGSTDSSTSDSGSSGSGSSGDSGGGSAQPSPPDNGGSDEPQPPWVVSLRVGAPGDTNLRELSSPQGLPSEDNPIVTFRGLTADGHKARFGVSEGVSAIFGDATCVKGTDRCELVEIERGLPVNFVYGPADKVYRVTVVQIRHN